MPYSLSVIDLRMKKVLLFLGLSFFLLLVTHPSLAATAGGGLPFDSWFTKIQKSVTGPFAYTVSIIGIVVAGTTLILGGDLNGFMRIFIFIVLVLSFLVAAQNTLSAITGKGAEISHRSMELQQVSLL